jgi:hypothetical protein
MGVGLHPERLYWWMNRLGVEGLADIVTAPGKARLPKRSGESAPRFVPVVVKTAAASATTPMVIRHGTKTTLEIDATTAVSAGWVAAVMIELERASCS